MYIHSIISIFQGMFNRDYIMSTILYAEVGSPPARYIVTKVGSEGQNVYDLMGYLCILRYVYIYNVYIMYIYIYVHYEYIYIYIHIYVYRCDFVEYKNLFYMT